MQLKMINHRRVFYYLNIFHRMQITDSYQSCSVKINYQIGSYPSTILKPLFLHCNLLQPNFLPHNIHLKMDFLVA